MMRLRSVSLALFAAVASCLLSSCSSGVATPASQALTLSVPGALSLPPGTAASSLQAVVGRASGNLNSVAFTVTGLPAGVTVAILNPYFGTYGSLTFTSAVSTAPGTYPVTVMATDGSNSITAAITMTVPPIDTVSITPANTAFVVRPDATTVNIPLTFGRSAGNSSAITASATGLPVGLLATFTQPGTGNTGRQLYRSACSHGRHRNFQHSRRRHHRRSHHRRQHGRYHARPLRTFSRDHDHGLSALRLQR